jgi:hypothetical protein
MFFLNLPTDHLSIFEWMGRSSWLALTIWHWRSNANTLDGGTWCYHCLIALSIFAFSFRHLDPPSKQCSGWISLVHLIYPCQCARRHMLRFLKDSTVHWKIFHSCRARCWKHLPAQVMHFIGSWPLSRDVTWPDLGDCGEGGGEGGFQLDEGAKLTKLTIFATQSLEYTIHTCSLLCQWR